MEPNPEKKPVYLTFIKAEIIFASSGTFATYQVNARCVEDVERYVVYKKNQGNNIGKPGIIDPATREIAPYEAIEHSLSDALPVVVFISTEIEVDSPYKFSSS